MDGLAPPLQVQERDASRVFPPPDTEDTGCNAVLRSIELESNLVRRPPGRRIGLGGGPEPTGGRTQAATSDC